MIDALKNFMSTMTDTIIQQASEQGKKAVVAMSPARPLSRFEYGPSHRHTPVVSHHHSEGMREAPHANRNRQSWGEHHDQFVRADALHSRPTRPPPEPWTTGKVNYGLNVACNLLPTKRLVRGAEADFKASRGSLKVATNPTTSL